jgi:MtfA peptidase
VKHFARELLTWLTDLWSPSNVRRRATARAPLPASTRRFLFEHSAHYRRLPAKLQREFHRQMQLFLAERRLTGVEMNVSEGLRLLVAASAVSLSVGWPGYSWEQVSEVLLYPGSFDRDYKFGEREYAGQADPWGIVILSAPMLRRSFKIEDEAYHVGFHEFAHLLDLTSGRFNGIPAYLSDEAIRAWEELAAKEEERLRHGDSILDGYALTGREEFFAVAVEAFFQAPAVLASRHAELYGFLASYFRQDPAAWSRTRPYFSLSSGVG